MSRNGYRVFDSDLHVVEPPDLYQRYLAREFQHRAPRRAQAHYHHGGWEVDGYAFPMPFGKGRTEAEARARVVLKEYAGQGYDPASQLHAMDVEGVDVAVLFRTLPVVSVDAFEPEFAIALCRAWNDWITDFRRLDRRRMHAAALLTLHDPVLAAQELRRAVRELEMVAGQMMSNPVNGRHLHDPSCDVLWAEAERLAVPICFHPAPNNYAQDHFINRFLSRPSTTITSGLNNPVELMAAVASMTVGGVLHRFPSLRVGFLEGNCSWLPWLLWRLDEYWEMSKGGEEVQLDDVPSAYFRRQCFISVDPDEHLAKWFIEELGDEMLVFSTDYPHSDSRFPEAVGTFLGLDISARSKEKILWDNCARLYRID